MPSKLKSPTKTPSQSRGGSPRAKKVGARSKKKVGSRHTASVTFAITAKQRKTVERLCKKHGMNISELGRRALQNYIELLTA